MGETCEIHKKCIQNLLQNLHFGDLGIDRGNNMWQCSYMLLWGENCIFWPITHTFFPEKCDLNSTCVLCAEGKYYFQTYKYPYIYYTTSLSWDSENNHEDDFSGIDDNFLGFCDE